MRPSEYYSRIETALAQDAGLSPIPRVANTYQEKLVDDEAAEQLRETGLCICYYFHSTSEVKNPRAGLVQVKGMFTIAVVENPHQHKIWLDTNTVPDFRAKSALEIAEEVIIALSESRELCSCGHNPHLEFGKPMLERVSAERGIVQHDINLLVDITIRKS